MFASAGSFGHSPKLKVESVSKSKAYFETFSYKLEVQKLARTPIFEPSLVSAASKDGRGIKAHDVCIKTVQDARF